MADGSSADIRLCNSAHFDCRLNADFHTALLQAVCHRKTVDYRCQHTHMVGTGALHTVAAVFDAAPEVSSADNNTDLYAGFHTTFDNIAYAADYVKIKTSMGITRKRFATDLQQNAAVFRLAHGKPLLFSVLLSSIL